MRQSYRIVLKQPVTEDAGSFCGQALIERMADLDWTAKELNVRPLSEFCSSEMFSAEEGLRSVSTLIREIGAWVVSPGETDELLRDLRACEHILDAAKHHGSTWHFEITSDHGSKG
jgi:hypothetical protein